MLVWVQKTPHVAEKEQVRPIMLTMFDCKVQWNPPKKCFFQKKCALCLSSNMVYQHLLYLLS